MKCLFNSKKQITLLLFATFIGVILLPSCRKNKDIKSLSEMLKEEKKTINKLIEKKNFSVKEYEKGQKEFDPNTFYLFENGLYMQVLNPGKERPIAEKTRINIRMKGEMILGGNTLGEFDSLSSGGFQDLEFKYVDRYQRGAIHYLPIASAPSFTLSNLLCEGLAFPMSLLGNGARVRLIIPFSIGPSVNYKEGKTMYCEDVRYEFSRF